MRHIHYKCFSMAVDYIGLLTVGLYMLVHSGISAEEPCHVSDVIIDDNRLVTRANCSHRNLTEIPVILPDAIVVFHLESNKITKLGTKLGNSLSRYYKLEVLHLACNPIEHLSADNFLNLSSLRELDVSGTHYMEYIDKDTFKYLPSINMLNMACASVTGYLPVMAALAAAPFVLDTLVIDAISKNHHTVMLTPKQFNIPSLLKLRRLSLRYNAIVGGDIRVLLQWIHVEHLSLGYNSPLGLENSAAMETEYILEFISMTNLIAIDISNLYNSEWRLKYCDMCTGRLHRQLSDYFQQPRFAVSDITNNKVYHKCNSSLHVPPSLRFLYASDMLWFAKGRIYDGQAAMFCDNNIQYFNVSGSNIGGLTYPIYGLVNLEVFDISMCEMSVLPDRFMTHFPKLKVLLMSHNNIPNTTRVLGTLANLQILDLSSNKMTNVPRDSFRGFTKLRNLDLSENLLENVDFDVSDLISLSHLDLSLNNIHRLGDSFMKELNELSNITTFSVSLQGNPLVCSCEFITFVSWIQQIFRSEHNILLADGRSLRCVYLNETSTKISDVGYDQMKQVCRDRIKLVDNLLKTVLIPVVTIVLMIGLVAVLCYILRHQIWWEWYVVFKGRKHVDIESFTRHAFIACDDNAISKGFVLHLERSTGRHVDSSNYLDGNMPEMEQNGRRMDSSKKVLFFVDVAFINSIDDWQLYIPHAVKTHCIEHIALVLDPNVLESSLRECFVLWRLSKSRSCFVGYYNGQDTNPDVLKSIQEFIKPDMNDGLVERISEQQKVTNHASANGLMYDDVLADDNGQDNEQHTSLEPTELEMHNIPTEVDGAELNVLFDSTGDTIPLYPYS